MRKYYRRIMDDLLKNKLDAKGAVLIQGPKWCGKTTTAARIAGSIIYMNDPNDIDQNIQLAQVSPAILLTGKTPRLIDEWQLAPNLWDAVRFEVDRRDEFGQFILTGSSTPVDRSKITHSGIGRIATLTLRPMSLFESQNSNGQVSLSALFAKQEKISSISDVDISRLAFLICRGGWPRAIDLKDDIALQQAIDYYDVLVNSDISEIDKVKRNPERVKLLMRSYARNLATSAGIPTLKKDMIENDSQSIDEDTIMSYIGILKEMFVIDDVKAWNPNLRSKATIRVSDTRYFVDPSIACAALQICPNDLINDLKMMGVLFESMCIRDLRVYAEKLNGEIFHFRDSNGLETDAIIHLRDGNWAAIEIKLGSNEIEKAAENLKKLKTLININKMKAPTFLMVLTGGKYAYLREDGVYVVPLCCLKD